MYVLSDELNYISLARTFSENLSLHTKSFYYKSLIIQDPPLQGPHNPGFQILLGTFFKIAGFSEKTIVLYNFFILFTFVISFSYFLKKYHTDEKITLTIILLLMGYPLVVKYAQQIMAEITVMATTFFLIYLMFYYVSEKYRFVYYLCVSFTFWSCFLIRQNVVFLLPGFFYFFYRRNDFKELLYVVLTGCLYLPLVFLLTKSKIYLSYSFSNDPLHFAPSMTEFIALTVQNFSLNIERMLYYFPTIQYTVNKVLLYQLTFLSLLSFFALDSYQKKLYKIVFSYFLLNTLVIFCFYDHYSWRFLRLSVQFVPFFITLTVLGISNVMSGNRRSLKWAAAITLIFSTTIFYMSSAYTISENNSKKQIIHARQKEYGDSFYKYIHGEGGLSILTNVDLRRGLIDFPENTFTFILIDSVFNKKSFTEVNKKMNFDFVFLKARREVLFLHDAGYKLMEKDGFYYVYKKA